MVIAPNTNGTCLPPPSFCTQTSILCYSLSSSAVFCTLLLAPPTLNPSLSLPFPPDPLKPPFRLKEMLQHFLFPTPMNESLPSPSSARPLVPFPVEAATVLRQEPGVGVRSLPAPLCSFSTMCKLQQSLGHLIEPFSTFPRHRRSKPVVWTVSFLSIPKS